MSIDSNSTIQDKLVLALRNRYRFDSVKGPRSLEDLMGMTTTALNDMYEQHSIVQGPRSTLMVSSKRTAEAEMLQVKLDLIEYIFNLKTQEAKNLSDKAAARKSLQARLQELEERQNGKIKTITDDELAKEIAALKGILDS